MPGCEFGGVGVFRWRLNWEMTFSESKKTKPAFLNPFMMFFFGYNLLKYYSEYKKEIISSNIGLAITH